WPNIRHGQQQSASSKKCTSSVSISHGEMNRQRGTLFNHGCNLNRLWQSENPSA
ncbi:hypothetical protein ACLOJK_006447, partial [Asimina triloba]